MVKAEFMASLIQLFAINDALNSALTIADRLESDIVHK
jgi:hypothetical protein